MTINKPTASFFTGRMPFRSPNQQRRSTEGKMSHSMDLLTPSSPGVFKISLTTYNSWLPWGRVAVLLISPMMPVSWLSRTNTKLTNYCTLHPIIFINYTQTYIPHHMLKYSAETHESSKTPHHRTFQQVVDYVRFNSHFPSEPGLAGVYWSKRWRFGGGDKWTIGAISRAKLQSNHHHQQTNIQFFLQAGCPSGHPTNSVEALKGKCHILWTCLPQVHLGSSNLVWPLTPASYYIY